LSKYIAYVYQFVIIIIVIIIIIIIIIIFIIIIIIIIKSVVLDWLTRNFCDKYLIFWKFEIYRARKTLFEYETPKHYF